MSDNDELREAMIASVNRMEPPNPGYYRVIMDVPDNTVIERDNIGKESPMTFFKTRDPFGAFVYHRLVAPSGKKPWGKVRAIFLRSEVAEQFLNSEASEDFS